MCFRCTQYIEELLSILMEQSDTIIAAAHVDEDAENLEGVSILHYPSRLCFHHSQEYHEVV